MTEQLQDALDKAKEALRVGEIRYLNLISVSDQVVYRHNADWSEMRQLSGGGFLADTSEPDPDWFNKYIHPDDQQHVWARIQEAIRTATPFEYEHRVLREDGTLGWTYSRSVPIKDEHGNIVEWFGAASDVTERKEAEQALRESEERLRLAVENAEIGFWDVQDGHGNLTWPARTKAMFGISADVPVTMDDFYAGLHPDDLERVTAAYEAAADPARRELYDVEYRTIGKEDGVLRWVAAKGRGVFNGPEPRARCLRVVGTAIEITSRKNVEEALREESRNLEILNTVASSIASELDLERLVQLVTDAAVELTGAKFGAFFYHATDASGEKLTLYTLSGANRADFDRFGHPRPTAVFAPTFKGEGVVRSDDITADPRYGKNAPHHGMPANHLPVRSYLAVPVISRSGEVIGGLFFGHPKKGVFGPQTEQLMVGIAGQAAVAIDNARLFDSAQRANQDLEQRVLERTSELEAAHEALRQAQKMEAIGQLTGGLAHDFNNLLTGVIGSLDMMQRQIARGDQAKIERYANTALASANRAAALTHRLLAFARRQPLDPKPVNANRLVTGMEDLLRRTIGESITLEIVTAGGLWQTCCDPHQLESAILNLAINSRDAMPDGGVLTIETCNARLDNAYAAQQRDVAPGQYICICVTDTGAGMSPDTIEKAFEPFFTTKPMGQGTGLGLSMVYGFTRQSEGYARIYSEVGSGTTVKIYLPRYYGTVNAGEEQREAFHDVHRTDSGEVVLVVEDEAGVRSLVVDVLEELGYKAIEAADGPTGLKLLQSDKRIDLLVTDIGLPGLNGRQVADAARQSRPGLQVLFMTGYAENATIANGFLEPGMQMITKPFAVEALATRIRDMIDQAGR